MTEAELASLMEQQDFKEQMDLLGLHPTEAHGLFRLLDDDCSGLVSIEEFLSGCIRLKGTAKAVDMITLLFETNKLNRRVCKISKILAEATGSAELMMCASETIKDKDALSDSPEDGKSTPSS